MMKFSAGLVLASLLVSTGAFAGGISVLAPIVPLTDEQVQTYQDLDTQPKLYVPEVVDNSSVWGPRQDPGLAAGIPESTTGSSFGQFDWRDFKSGSRDGMDAKPLN